MRNTGRLLRRRTTFADHGKQSASGPGRQLINRIGLGRMVGNVGSRGMGFVPPGLKRNHSRVIVRLDSRRVRRSER